MSEKRKGILKLVILAVLLAGAQILLKKKTERFSLYGGWRYYCWAGAVFHCASICFPDSVIKAIWWQKSSVSPVLDF